MYFSMYIMNISFHGAAGEVTGSATLIEFNNGSVLIDCGMFQGGEFADHKNLEPFNFNPSVLSAVIITHAHLDHIGRLPLLFRDGYRGFIFATPPTVDLIKIVLEDALNVMRYNHKKINTPILYDENDLKGVLGLLKNIDYYEECFIAGNKASFKFYEAGHVFGSAFVEILVEGKKIVFSGDLGNDKVPILRDNDKLPDDVDLLVCESTYGDRLHDTRYNRKDLIKKVISEAISRGGTILIPAFSVERTQEILYDLNELIDIDQSLPDHLRIFLDSPMAIDATNVFNHYTNYYDEEARDMIFSGDELFHFKGLTVTYSAEESKRINAISGQKIIIAGAGMMNGGRIIHHAIRYLSDTQTTLFFTGYQAMNTLGRKILDGDKVVKIFGQKIPVNCNIVYYDVLSAHADQIKLYQWIYNDGNVPKKVILNHGDPRQSLELQNKLQQELGLNVDLAERDRRFSL